MWPFRRKKARENTPLQPLCQYCQSTNTRLAYSSESDQPDYIRTWRGQRYVICKCLDCGREFYIEEPIQDIEMIFPLDDSFIADEDELLAAEEELRRQIDEEDDRRHCRIFEELSNFSFFMLLFHYPFSRRGAVLLCAFYDHGQRLSSYAVNH